MSWITKYGPIPAGSWVRVKEMDKGGVLGHWEHSGTRSMITITKGLVHIVHRGAAMTFEAPEEAYSSNPNTIAKMTAKQLNLFDADETLVWE